MDKQTIIYLLYLVASVMFIFGLKRMSTVKGARGGNLLATCAMFIGIGAVLWNLSTDAADPKFSWVFIAIGIGIGSVIGAIAATRVAMTDMPQMVAVFNGLGGGASTLVALSTFFDSHNRVGPHALGPSNTSEEVSALGTVFTNFTLDGLVGGADVSLTLALSVLIGSITFSGSIIAFAKLQELMKSEPVLLPGRNFINAIALLGAIALTVAVAFFIPGIDTLTLALIGLTVLALILGVLAVIPIGGADMPVVISLLNSYSGIAAAMAGFVVKNNVLIISGALVGAAGLILTNLMCKAMNRSLANVMFAGFGAEGGAKDAREYKNISTYTAEDSALAMADANSVVIVPGYGLAVAQAQHATREMGELLEKRGVQVRYAIHPVAGRMPGHMNVLLAEANVPYEVLVEMDEVNPDFKNTDVVLILGANDVVNPAALDDPKSPIYGMPILNVHDANQVLVIKRSLAPGFAGIRNPLFDLSKTHMIFDDAKKAINGIVEELKKL